MNYIDCGHCGAKMTQGGECPVCQLPQARVAAVPEREGPLGGSGTLARLWQSGQLPIGLGAILLVAAIPLPMIAHVPLRAGEVKLSIWDLIMGTSGAFRGRLAWMVPGAAAFLFSLLRSRSTASAMRASRPLALVVALAPAVAIAMPFALLHKHHASATVGVGAVVALTGVALCVLGALRFGEGAPDELPRSDDDED